MEVARAIEIFDYWFSGPDNYVVVWTKFTQVKRDGRGGGLSARYGTPVGHIYSIAEQRQP